MDLAMSLDEDFEEELLPLEAYSDEHEERARNIFRAQFSDDVFDGVEIMDLWEYEEKFSVIT